MNLKVQGIMNKVLATTILTEIFTTQLKLCTERPKKL